MTPPVVSPGTAASHALAKSAGSQSTVRTSIRPLPLADASARLRTVPGLPRRPGRPPTRPLGPAAGPARHVPRHVLAQASGEPRENAVIETAVPQDSRSNGPRLVDVAGAARYLGVSTWTVRDLIERGALARVDLPGVRRVLVDQRDLDRLVDASRRSA